MAQLSPSLRARLEKLPAAAVEGAARAMEAMAKEIVAEMQAAAPKDSGDLRDSIGWTWGDAPAGTLAINEIRSGKNKGEQFAGLRITIYAGRHAGNDKAFYARFIEHGTVKAAARPFFYPVWKKNRAEFRKRIRAEVQRSIKEL